MRLAVPLSIVALAAALLAGCGGSSSSTGGSTETGTGGSSQASTPGGPSAPIGAAARSCDSRAVDAEGLRAVGVSCGKARKVMYGWQLQGSCAAPSGSRSSCSVRSYRCLSGRTDRGLVVGCSRPGESVAFIAKPR